MKFLLNLQSKPVARECILGGVYLVPIRVISQLACVVQRLRMPRAPHAACMSRLHSGKRATTMVTFTLWSRLRYPATQVLLYNVVRMLPAHCVQYVGYVAGGQYEG